jgi:hypothetical protein
VVSAGELRKVWDSLSELRGSPRERRLERTVLRHALLPAKTVPAGELRKLWDSLSGLRSSLCETRLERAVLWSACQKCAVYSDFLSDIMSHSKIAQFN